VFAKPAQLTKTTQLLEVRSAIFNYAVEYAAAHPDLTQEITVTPDIIEGFVQYAAGKNIATIDEIRQALQKPEDRNFIERSLKAEIVAAKYGYDASYTYRLQGDSQVAKALELFPEAQKLATLASDMRLKGGAQNPADAGSRAAQANTVPKTN
jgi:hypothetical protein